MIQRFEFTDIVGGFTEEEAAREGSIFIEDRDNFPLPVVLSRQQQQVENALIDLLNSIHSPNQTDQMRRDLMIREALANQMIHGNAGNAILQSDVHLIVEQHREVAGHQLLSCVLLLDDHSPRFDLSKVPNPSDDENLERTTGRGLMFIREVGKATMVQIPRENNGKTIVYHWTERTEPKKNDSDAAPE